MKPRRYQNATPPADFPPALRAQLARPRWSMADRFAREEIFTAYRPKIAEALARDHVAIAGPRAVAYWKTEPGETVERLRDSWRDAMAHTISQHRELERAHLTRAFDEQEIRDYADNYSRLCSRMGSLEHRFDFVRSLGIEPPRGRTVTDQGASARCDDSQWWRRQLRRTWTRRAENVMREIGIVRKGREPYASDDAVTARAVMKAKGRKFLENHEAVNEKGEQLSLFKLAEHSLANPALRRGEFMCRVRGFEEIARDAKHDAQFWTLTAPSAFHAQLAAGIKNPNFARAAVRDAQAWLCKQWAKVRAKLKRLSILLYGFRIAEPHHDATPHWHLLLFCRPRDSATIEFVVRDYWVNNDKKYRNEKGAAQYRAKLETIDPSKGSAAGYVAKYVSKNIDGAGAIGEATDEEAGGTVGGNICRVDAWASLHGIRQFQQIGGPPVGLWRELRRLTTASADDEIERARGRADVGDWAGFIRAIAYEGIRAGRRVSVRIEREETGELTKYAEEKAAPVVGVRCCSAVEITRPHSWRIQRCGTLSLVGDRAPAEQSSSDSSDVLTDVRAASYGSAIFGGNTTRASGLTGLRLNPLQWSKRKGRSGRNAKSPCQGVGMTTDTGILSGSFSSIFSDLGPVAITVRGHSYTSEAGGGEVPATRPDFAASPGKADHKEFWRFEAAANACFRRHGRWPTLDETLQIDRGSA